MAEWQFVEPSYHPLGFTPVDLVPIRFELTGGPALRESLVGIVSSMVVHQGKEKPLRIGLAAASLP